MRLKLGEATTNTQGIAVYEYTGTGTGELSVRAKAGALISDVHSFWDTLMFDLATSTYHTDSIWNNLDYITRGDEYSTIYREDGDAMKYITISGNICIECDVMTTMANSGGVFNIRNASGNIKSITGTDVGGASGNWVHVKLSIINNKLTVEGSSIVDFDVTGFDRFTIRAASTYSTYFKNLIVYRVGDAPAPVEPVVTAVTLNASASSITVGGSVVFTAIVKDQYGSVMSGETVTFKEGSTTLGTGTTDSSGVVTLSKSDLTVGSHTITAVCGSVNSSSVTVSVSQASVVTSLTVSADKSVLSYYDSESAILSALVKDQNGSVMSGQTVVFKKGSSTLATKTTNSSGVATYDYSASGSGDVTFTVECSNLQETYSLEDCSYYNATLYNSTSNTTLNVPLPNGAFTLEYDSIPTTRSTGSTPYLDIGSGTNNRILIGQYARAGTCGIITYTGTQTNYPLPSVSELNTVNHYTFTYDGSNYKIDRNGENITVNGVGITFTKIIHIEGGSGGSLQYIKVKPL
jgi:hypothetical protein